MISAVSLCFKMFAMLLCHMPLQLFMRAVPVDLAIELCEHSAQAEETLQIPAKILITLPATTSTHEVHLP